MPALATATCSRCNGTGQYHGTRRNGSAYIGSCFTCQGYSRAFGRRGGFHHSPAPVAPVAIPEAPLPHIVPTQALGLARGDAALVAVSAAHPAEYGWLVSAQSTGNEFAMSLLSGIKRYGNLTPRQLAAVRRNLPTQAPIAAEAIVADMDSGTIGRADPQIDGRGRGFGGTTPTRSQAEIFTGALAAVNAAPRLMPAATPAPAILIEAGPLRAALDAAAASGLRKVRLTLGHVEFKLAGSRFRHGTGMILCYHGGTYQGWINRYNVFTKGATVVAVTTETLDAFRAAAADPQAAARAHGNDTGYCACCRRLLTDPVSVMQQIGPVCARRFGWSRSCLSA